MSNNGKSYLTPRAHDIFSLPGQSTISIAHAEELYQYCKRCIYTIAYSLDSNECQRGMHFQELCEALFDAPGSDKSTRDWAIMLYEEYGWLCSLPGEEDGDAFVTDHLQSQEAIEVLMDQEMLIIIAGELYAQFPADREARHLIKKLNKPRRNSRNRRMEEGELEAHEVSNNFIDLDYGRILRAYENRTVTRLLRKWDVEVEKPEGVNEYFDDDSDSSSDGNLDEDATTDGGDASGVLDETEDA